MRSCVKDLERTGQLVRITEEVSPDLEMAEIHRRIYEAGGPAILFEKVKGSPFQAVSNIYGTNERCEFLFRHTIRQVEKIIQFKIDPTVFLRSPGKYLKAPFTALKALPRHSRRAPVKYGETNITQLPQLISWPDDGGAFITLPQVCTLPPGETKLMKSNLGMYRIQMSGNEYRLESEIGMHYQIHRGIGVHHTLYKNSDEPFRASIFIGGPPAHALSAIFPLPEGLSELTFAGMLAGRRFRYHRDNGFIISNDADFVITGTIRKREMKPEGPFGDHLGYYSLKHDFPVMEVDSVYHRKDPLWHFTVVGRPPQEDTGFGHMIHKLVGPLLPQEFPGVKSLHAVDAAGVHPLLLAIGSERYMPFRDPKPEEILTQANHILGSGQTSLAKYLFIAAANDNPKLDVHDIPGFFQHVLSRIDLQRDLHFQTRTTIDTLDYSGTGLNEGSKLVIACCGSVQRELASNLPTDLVLPDQFAKPTLMDPGILTLQGPKFTSYEKAEEELQQLMAALESQQIKGIPFLVLVDDPGFTTATWNNFLWVTFTRSNPSHDVYGCHAKFTFKHWGCEAPLIIDARLKPHHAPPLVSDPDVAKKVDSFMKGHEKLKAYI